MGGRVHAVVNHDHLGHLDRLAGDRRQCGGQDTTPAPFTGVITLIASDAIETSEMLEYGVDRCLRTCS